MPARLDPAATGILAVALGEATKTVPFVADALKAYRFTMRSGQATDTDDAEGVVIAESALRPTDAALAAALAPFRGDILQVPPQYSAVKVDGERAYDLARAGETTDLAARPLYVESLDPWWRGPIPTMRCSRWSAARVAMCARSRGTSARRSAALAM